jgi:hypothetical protein
MPRVIVKPPALPWSRCESSGGGVRGVGLNAIVDGGIVALGCWPECGFVIGGIWLCVVVGDNYWKETGFSGGGVFLDPTTHLARGLDTFEDL